MSISVTEYALMAGASYDSTRAKINKIPFSEYLGWKELGEEKNLNHRVINASGFEAAAYLRQSDGSIVISYAGTYFPQTADILLN